LHRKEHAGRAIHTPLAWSDRNWRHINPMSNKLCLTDLLCNNLQWAFPSGSLISCGRARIKH